MHEHLCSSFVHHGVGGECGDILKCDCCFDAVKLGALACVCVLFYVYVPFAIENGVESALINAWCSGPATILFHLCLPVVVHSVHCVSQVIVSFEVPHWFPGLMPGDERRKCDGHLG